MLLKVSVLLCSINAVLSTKMSDRMYIFVNFECLRGF